MASERTTPSDPIEIVAHRAGNSVDAARAARTTGHIIELDAHVLYGRVEVRHEKVIRPTRRLWERWYLLPRGTRGIAIEDVLDAVGPDAELMLDLKCYTRRGARRILARVPDSRRLIVSTRSWWVLSVCRDRPHTRWLRSCGNRFQLFLVRWLTRRPAAIGLSIHERLVDKGALDELRTRVDDIFCWGATTSERCGELVVSGVTGLILDDPSLAAAL